MLGDHLCDHLGSMCNIIQSCIKTLANLVSFVSFSIYLCSYKLSYGRTKIYKTQFISSHIPGHFFFVRIPHPLSGHLTTKIKIRK